MPPEEWGSVRTGKRQRRPRQSRRPNRRGKADVVSQDFEYVTIGPGDECSVGKSPDGEPGILIEQTAFEEPDRWLCFGEGFDDVRRMRELAAALHDLAARAERGEWRTA